MSTVFEASADVTKASAVLASVVTSRLLEQYKSLDSCALLKCFDTFFGCFLCFQVEAGRNLNK